MSPAPKATKAKAGKPASKPAAKTKAPAKVAKAAPATPKKAAAGKAAAKVKPSATAKEISAAVALPVTEVAPILMTPEEQALAAMYGDEMAAPATAHAEFRDRHTADEDRPMSPEISAREERNKQWAQRRDEGRDRGGRGRRSRFRDRDGRDGQREGGGARPGGAANPQQARPQQGGGTPNVQQPRQAVPPHVQQARLPQPPPAAHSVGMVDGTGDDATPVGNRIGTQLGDGAALVFAELRNAQPMPVRQLAGMMRKRGLMTGDPELTWPNLKGALLADERSYRAAGLRPRLVYRGRDLFAPGPVTTSLTGGAEAELAEALGGLATATHTALRGRLTRASAAGFERIIHSYLIAVGYRDLEWVKRVDGISYGSALPPDGDRPIMISARSGDSPVDRRGIGELRVGLEAKQALWGLLCSARELSGDAEKELERPGRSVTTLCGNGLVAALIAAGVGVVTAAAPIRYVDDQLLDELLAG